jgi:hypothetical protein
LGTGLLSLALKECVRSRNDDAAEPASAPYDSELPDLVEDGLPAVNTTLAESISWSAGRDAMRWKPCTTPDSAGRCVGPSISGSWIAYILPNRLRGC